MNLVIRCRSESLSTRSLTPSMSTPFCCASLICPWKGGDGINRIGRSEISICTRYSESLNIAFPFYQWEPEDSEQEMDFPKSYSCPGKALHLHCSDIYILFYLVMLTKRETGTNQSEMTQKRVPCTNLVPQVFKLLQPSCKCTPHIM